MVLPLLEVDFPEPSHGATEISAYRASKVGFDLMTGSIQGLPPAGQANYYGLFGLQYS
jgi:hypothetical protein